MGLVVFLIIFVPFAVLMIIGCLYAIWENVITEIWSEIKRYKRNKQKKNIKINPRYEGSIKCKYCAHFNSRTSHCHLYSQFDASIDDGDDWQYSQYYRDTTPDGICADFMLPAKEIILRQVEGAQGRKRSDGSDIVSLYEASL